MVLKFRYGRDGKSEFHGPPYTKQEETELYRKMAAGPHRQASSIRVVQRPADHKPSQEARRLLRAPPPHTWEERS